jgi:hypothetical protein
MLTDAAALIAALATAAKIVPDAVQQIHAWIAEDGPKPDAVLPELPDLVRGDLELLAMKERARRAGNIP